MVKKLNDFLAGLPMTIVGGAFLLMDLAPHLAEEFGGGTAAFPLLPFDPAWETDASHDNRGGRLSAHGFGAATG